MPRRMSTAVMITVPLTAIFALFTNGAQSQGGAKAYPGAHGGEITLPMGDISFADRVVSFTEGSPLSSVDNARDPAGATGPLDYDFGRDTGKFATSSGDSISNSFHENTVAAITDCDPAFSILSPDQRN